MGNGTPTGGRGAALIPLRQRHCRAVIQFSDQFATAVGPSSRVALPYPAMNELLHVGLTLFVASALALWNGWGLARLLLPAALQPWRALLAPLLGYALTILVGY